MNKINHAFYINLESRPDRKLNVEQELLKVGIKAQRFNAIRLPNGALGCSMSHLKCLETAKQNNWGHVCIVEDDIQFLKPQVFVQQCKLALAKKSDVVLLAGNNVPPYVRIDDSCVKVSRCQTTTGYIVKQHYYDRLIANIKEGINKLLREPEKHVLYAIDKYWFQLQEIDTWLLVTPLTVTQREDYSDIENRHTNYTRAMIDLDKAEFFKAQREAHEKYMLTQMKIT